MSELVGKKIIWCKNEISRCSILPPKGNNIWTRKSLPSVWTWDQTLRIHQVRSKEVGLVVVQNQHRCPVEPFNHPPTLPRTVCVSFSGCVCVSECFRSSVHTHSYGWRRSSAAGNLLAYCSSSSHWMTAAKIQDSILGRFFFLFFLFHSQCGCTQQREITSDKWTKNIHLLIAIVLYTKLR